MAVKFQIQVLVHLKQGYQGDFFLVLFAHRLL